MTTTEIILLVCVAIGFLWAGFELGMMEAQRRTKIIIPASFADIMNGTHLWKPASEPPDDDRFVFTCVRDNDVPQCIGIACFKNGRWYDDMDEICFIDYWMDVPSLPKKEDKK